MLKGKALCILKTFTYQLKAYAERLTLGSWSNAQLLWEQACH